MADSEAAAASSDEFPNLLESEVASALLLLSCTTTTTVTPPPTLTLYPPPLKNNDMKRKRRMKLVKKSSKRLSLSSSSSSSIVTENEKHLNLMAMVSKFHKTITLEVVRKKRSKSLYISSTKKSSSGITSSKSEDSTVAPASCVSNCSADVISTAVSRRREVPNMAGRTKDPERNTVIGSGHLGRLAESIMKLLSSHSSASEVKIRQLLGDSPSTSKALRILLKMEKVKRSGGGGRSDPYIYMIA